MTYAVLNGFLDDAVQLRGGSPWNSLGPCGGHHKLEFHGRPGCYARANPAFDKLDEIPITGTAGTQLSQEIAELGKGFASRSFEAIDTVEHDGLPHLLHPKLVQLQEHRGQGLCDTVMEQAGELPAHLVGVGRASCLRTLFYRGLGLSG